MENTAFSFCTLANYDSPSFFYVKELIVGGVFLLAKTFHTYFLVVETLGIFKLPPHGSTLTKIGMLKSTNSHGEIQA